MGRGEGLVGIRDVCVGDPKITVTGGKTRAETAISQEGTVEGGGRLHGLLTEPMETTKE